MSALTTCLCMEVTSCADNMKKAQWYGGVFLHGVWAYPVNSQIILLCEKKTKKYKYKWKHKNMHSVLKNIVKCKKKQ